MRFGLVFFSIGLALTTGCGSDNPSNTGAVTCPQGMEPCSNICVALGTCGSQTQNTGAVSSGGSGTAQAVVGAGGTGQKATGTGSAGQGSVNSPSNAGTGAGGSGASSSTPVTTGSAKALTCPNGVSVPADDVISDFSQTTPVMYKTAGANPRGGMTWLSWAATTAPTLTIDSANPGPCKSGGSLKITAPGTSGWGEAFGIDFQPADANKKKGTYDASGYTGIGFWAKCTPERGFIYFKVLDAANDADVQTASGTAPCSYSSEPSCTQYGIKNVTVTDKDWTYYKVYFSELLQDPYKGTGWGKMGGLDATKLTSFQIQLNTPYDTSGTNSVATPSNCWVDDVHFIKDTAPAPKSTCATAYTVSGNKIVCGTATKVFRGVARPSMEWDISGWNITPWDMDRIKGWKANLVRFTLNQDYYMNKYADIYPKYVARSVKWAEAAGMDVILDLHWVDDKHQSPTQGYMASAATKSPAFWTAVATAYKSDPHVMFELYNEPTISDWGAWKTNFQAMTDAVRGAGANNIVIIGGLDWAYDLSKVITDPSTRITGKNIVYNTHPYGNKAPSSDWPGKFGNLAATFPVFATEFGTYDCGGDWTKSLIAYMEGLGMSWTAWAWYVAPTGQDCQFPSLISDYSGTVLAGGNAQASKDGLLKNP